MYMPEEHTFYTRFLDLYVYDAKECRRLNSFSKNLPSQIWRGLSWNVDEYGFLRSHLDFLLIPLMDIFGKNTIGAIENNVYADDQRVALLRETYLNPIKSV